MGLLAMTLLLASLVPHHARDVQHQQEVLDDAHGSDGASLPAAARSAAAAAAAAELRAFYARYRPGQLARVDTIVFRYVGKEADIIPDLQKKYQSEPPLVALVWIIDNLPTVANAIGKDALLDGIELAWSRGPAVAGALLVAVGLVSTATRMRRGVLSKGTPSTLVHSSAAAAESRKTTVSVSMAVPIAAFVGGVSFAVLLCLFLRNNTAVVAMLMERGMVTVT